MLGAGVGFGMVSSKSGLRVLEILDFEQISLHVGNVFENDPYLGQLPHDSKLQVIQSNNKKKGNASDVAGGIISSV